MAIVYVITWKFMYKYNEEYNLTLLLLPGLGQEKQNHQK